jgi:ribonuclease E
MGEAQALPETRREEGEDRRERRSRDRYGRDRRERAPREEAAPASAEDAAPLATEDRRPRYPTGFVSDEEVTAAESQPAREAVAAPAVQPAPAPQPAPSPRTASAASQAAPQAQPVVASEAPRQMPRIARFELPLAQLKDVAEGSGLQWVNSDADKVAAVQAAIAAEPKPVRVPRERPPAVAIDEGPLVLVETRRDLSELKLPFEQQSLPLQ